jgi:hypothetical protein
MFLSSTEKKPYGNANKRLGPNYIVPEKMASKIFHNKKYNLKWI